VSGEHCVTLTVLWNSTRCAKVQAVSGIGKREVGHRARCESRWSICETKPIPHAPAQGTASLCYVALRAGWDQWQSIPHPARLFPRPRTQARSSMGRRITCRARPAAGTFRILRGSSMVLVGSRSNLQRKRGSNPPPPSTRSGTSCSWCAAWVAASAVLAAYQKGKERGE